MIDARTIAQIARDDAKTNASYASRFRAMDTSLGRWTRTDPLGYFDGANGFSYVADSPVANRDPLGLCKECEHNDIRDDWMAAENGNRLGNFIFGPSPNCDDWANPGRPNFMGTIVTAGMNVGAFRMGDVFNDEGDVDWERLSQVGRQAFRKALEAALNQPGRDGKPQGFILDNLDDECPCGYYKSTFFIRPTLGDYHFQHYSCRSGKWSQKEGPYTGISQVDTPGVDSSGGGYLVAAYCAQGKERHTYWEVMREAIRNTLAH